MSVISFGSCKNGQLGQESQKDCVDPTVIQFLKGKRVVSVACGESHSLGVTSFGDIYSWGRAKEGQLGLGSDQKANFINHPQVIKGLLHERISKVVCGNFHSLALSDTGKVYEWGQLHKISQKDNVIGPSTDLVQMPGLSASYYAEKSLSMYLNGEKDALDTTHEMINSNPNAENDEQEVIENSQGEDEQARHKHIGRIVDHIVYSPELVTALEGEEIVDIAAGWAFSAAVTKSGKLYTWGFNEKGQLGQMDRWFHGSPRLVRTLLNVKVVSVACGKQHMCILTDNGLLYSWGLGIFGQLGHGKLKSYLHPVLCKYFVHPSIGDVNASEEVLKEIEAINFNNPMSIKPKIDITQVVCGANFTVCKTNEGKLYSFGHGEYAQLGCITEESQHMDWNRSNGESNHLSYSKPTLIRALEDKRIKFVACGHLHVIAVTDENDTYAWGWGSSGCLGFGNRRFYLVPSLVPSLSGEEISSISAGEKHTLVVRSSDLTTFAFDYKNLIQDKTTADIIFKVQDKSIYAHSFFIKSRCPKLYSIILFDKRFNSANYQLNEEGKREIELTNVKQQIFLGLLNYIYTDHLILPPHLRNELADYATKMGIPRLASLCRQHHFRLRKLERIPLSTFSEDIVQFLEPGESTCDITFKSKSDDTDFLSAHKHVLLNRNPYFKTMFECSFKESSQNHFILGEDINLDHFKLVLNYIYASDSNIVNQDNAIDLLCLADRFMIDDLKHVCEYFLEQMIQSNIATLKDYIKLKNFNDTTQRKTTLNHIKGLLSAVFEKKVKEEHQISTEMPQREEDYESAINSFENICILMDVADKFLAKRLHRVAVETFTQIPIQTLNKFLVM